MKRRMIERMNERSNKWMNEWIDTRKREYTDEQRNESKKSKYKEWNTLHSWFYLMVPKLPYRVVGLEDFGCDTVKFTWSSTRLCYIFMTSPRWQFISCQYSTFLPLYSTEDKWFALLSLGISCSPPPPPQIMSGLQEKNMIRHDTLKIHYLDTYCMWKHTPGN